MAKTMIRRLFDRVAKDRIMMDYVTGRPIDTLDKLKGLFEPETRRWVFDGSMSNLAWDLSPYSVDDICADPEADVLKDPERLSDGRMLLNFSTQPLYLETYHSPGDMIREDDGPPIDGKPQVRETLVTLPMRGAIWCPQGIGGVAYQLTPDNGSVKMRLREVGTGSDWRLTMIGAVKAMSVLTPELREARERAEAVPYRARPLGEERTGEIKLVFNKLRGYAGTRVAQSAEDKHGRRFHLVRGHWMEYAEGKTTWRKSHWRGDPTLGCTIPVTVASVKGVSNEHG